MDRGCIVIFSVVGFTFFTMIKMKWKQFLCVFLRNHTNGFFFVSDKITQRFFWIMPVESSQDTPLVQYHHRHPSHHHHHFLPCYAEGLGLVPGPDDLCLSSTAEHIAASAAALSLDSNDNLISTHSPPLINLSPNLSPSSESRVSPFYDFRETTRRRSAQGKFFL